MIDYTQVTETPGSRITREALQMMYTRYAYAASLCQGRSVLEVACASGQGLGHLARMASRVVGGDCTENLLKTAHRHYRNRVPLVRLDAHFLPFRDHTFDVVVLYEAIYYLARPEHFLRECRRVLRKAGVTVMCTANRERSDFNPSPFSHRYFSSLELAGLLQAHGFMPELYGAFAVTRGSVRNRVVSMMKRAAGSLHLIPRTMRGKEFLKRIFLGKLVTIPAELWEGMVEPAALTPLDASGVVSQYRVLYAIGRLP